MPKENTYGHNLPYGDDDPARSVVELSWSRVANHVQIATRCIHMADETTYKNDDYPTLTAADGWYVDLDRYAINKLIRDLRRARDQAFGKDE